MVSKHLNSYSVSILACAFGNVEKYVESMLNEVLVVGQVA